MKSYKRPFRQCFYESSFATFGRLWENIRKVTFYFLGSKDACFWQHYLEKLCISGSGVHPYASQALGLLNGTLSLRTQSAL